MKTLLGIAILLTVGCTCELDQGTGPLGIPIAGEGYEGHDLKLPHQDEAIELVWKYTYGDAAVFVAPPPIVWRQGDECTDDDGKHWNGSFWCPAHKHCCNGFYNVQSKVAFVEYWGQPFHESSLAHELCHAWRVVEGDWTGDGTHSSVCYTPGTDGQSAEGSLTYEANRRLAAVGW